MNNIFVFSRIHSCQRFSVVAIISEVGGPVLIDAYAILLHSFHMKVLDILSLMIFIRGLDWHPSSDNPTGHICYINKKSYEIFMNKDNKLCLYPFLFASFAINQRHHIQMNHHGEAQNLYNIIYEAPLFPKPSRKNWRCTERGNGRHTVLLCQWGIHLFHFHLELHKKLCMEDIVMKQTKG